MRPTIRYWHDEEHNAGPYEANFADSDTADVFAADHHTEDGKHVADKDADKTSK